MNTQDRFWQQVDVSGDCHIFTGRTYRGYGRFYDGTRDWTAHRLSWTWAYLALPADVCLDHLCGTKACVRPDHLEPVTWAENSRRAHAASRSAWPASPATPVRSDRALVRAIPDTPEARAYFDRRVVRSEHWTIASKQQRGTPHLLIDGKLWPAHYLSYAWWRGELHDDELVLRSCEVAKCVQPEHLLAVRRADHLRSRTTGLASWRAKHSASPAERAAKAQAKAEVDARLEGKAAAIRTLAAGMR